MLSSFLSFIVFGDLGEVRQPLKSRPKKGKASKTFNPDLVFKKFSRLEVQVASVVKEVLEEKQSVAKDQRLNLFGFWTKSASKFARKRL